MSISEYTRINQRFAHLEDQLRFKDAEMDELRQEIIILKGRLTTLTKKRTALSHEASEDHPHATQEAPM